MMGGGHLKCWDRLSRWNFTKGISGPKQRFSYQKCNSKQVLDQRKLYKHKTRDHLGLETKRPSCGELSQ